MKLKTPIIRPVRREDLEVFYPGMAMQTVRGFAIEIDGQPEVVCGILYSMPLQCFSTISDKAKRYPKAIVQCARKLGKIMDTCQAPVLALASETEPTAERFLEHVGFERIEEGIYRWPTR